MLIFHAQKMSLIRSLSSDVFEPRKSTGSGLFPLMSRDFEQISEQSVFIRIKNLAMKFATVVSKHVKRENGLHTLEVRRSNCRCLNSLICY